MSTKQNDYSHLLHKQVWAWDDNIESKTKGELVFIDKDETDRPYLIIQRTANNKIRSSWYFYVSEIKRELPTEACILDEPMEVIVWDDKNVFERNQTLIAYIPQNEYPYITEYENYRYCKLPD